MYRLVSPLRIFPLLSYWSASVFKNAKRAAFSFSDNLVDSGRVGSFVRISSASALPTLSPSIPVRQKTEVLYLCAAVVKVKVTRLPSRSTRAPRRLSSST